MTYTYLSASYANEERTAIVAMTEEVAAVCISIEDTPDDWNDLISSGVDISQYVPPVISAASTKQDLLQQIEYLRQQVLSS